MTSSVASTQAKTALGASARTCSNVTVSTLIKWALLLVAFTQFGCASPTKKAEQLPPQKRCKGDLKNGKRHGLWKCSFADGSQHLEITYSEGIKHGSMKMWFRNGNPDTFSHWKHGTLAGHFESYYQNGQKHIETTYNERGQFDGPLKEWSEAGQKIYEANYSNNKVIGSARIWYPNGQLQSEIHYTKGVRDGPILLWYKSGDKRLVGNYKEDQRSGLWTCWTLDGQRHKITYTSTNQKKRLACEPPSSSKHP